jgi:hypothetical protein
MKANGRTNSQRWKLVVLFVCALLTSAVLHAWAQEQVAPQRHQLKTYHPKPPAGLDIEQIQADLQTKGSSPATSLPLWSYTVTSTRDGNRYSGVIVGASPFTHGGQKNVNVRGYVVPLIVVTNSIATSVDLNTGQYTTVPGVTTFDPNQPTGCLTAPNNIPSRLVAQSPIFNRAHFSFGGTDVGDTQYVDAFQRGNFWTALGANNIRQDYHVLLNPVRFLDPIIINVPASNGLAVTDPLLFGPPPVCTPMSIIDGGWLDEYLQTTVLPQLAARGIGSSDLTMFLMANVLMGSNPLFDNCCIDGYHGATPTIPVQTYLVADFDSTQFAVGIETGDIVDLSHEIAEWMNDPLAADGPNATPAWGNIEYMQGCESYLEVGDPLGGIGFPAVTMRNGFTYHLQELAFFSWFFGGHSLGVNGWYSNNDTFVTDAGPVCQ